MMLNDKTTLYHGSYVVVDKPDLAMCRPHKDFGQGFYLTTSHEQAVRFARTSVRKAIRRGELPTDTRSGYVSSFEFFKSGNLTIHEFATTDASWLHCVVAHRKSGHFVRELESWRDFDILVGKIANDNTNLVLTVFMNGGYGTIESSKATETALGFLLPDRLQDQICFRTEAALRALEYKGYEEILCQN
ncbi:DUF3990 domain-containing protein [Selenomonas ruminantium]|uniref:DUF3990 domain-containing protein n=1 Tax=Selenomonas ruminantium TaxID=971 RepID=UPI0026EAC770|nr:DUF3990 domain-containing protein [Selenomonas ruminantium]